MRCGNSKRQCVLLHSCEVFFLLSESGCVCVTLGVGVLMAGSDSTGMARESCTWSSV